MHGFTKIKNTPLPAFKMSASEYVHESGLGLIHLEKDDPNNYFCISFNTPPTSSNGVAHILEHCVLNRVLRILRVPGNDVRSRRHGGTVQVGQAFERGPVARLCTDYQEDLVWSLHWAGAPSPR